MPRFASDQRGEADDAENLPGGVGRLESVDEDTLSWIPVTCVDGMHDRWGSRPEFVSHL